MFSASFVRWVASVGFSGDLPEPRVMIFWREKMDELALLEQLVILGQYQLGMLAFLCGIVLCFVFVYGMRLR